MQELSKFTILVVDDEEMLRGLLAADFESRGFNVLTAASGDEAFEIVRSRRIDIVLSDMRMLGGDGISLLESIRAYDPEIPVVIFITGFADISEKDCIAKGASHVFSKPYDRKKLMGAVLAALPN